MTLLNKPITRELPLTFDRRSWIVELHPWGVSFRAKRHKQKFDITWERIWNRAMLIEAERVHAEKKTRKRAGR